MVDLRGSIEEQRQALENGCKARDDNLASLDLANAATATNLSVESRDSTFKIPIRIYRPKHIAEDSESLPVAVYYHGGGWTLGSIEADDIFCRMICRDLGHLVVSVDYRLAPEHPHPVALNDCYDVLEWVSKIQIHEEVERLLIRPGLHQCRPLQDEYPSGLRNRQFCWW